MRIQAPRPDSYAAAQSDWATVRTQVIALYDSGAQPSDISLRLRLRLQLVLKAISQRNRDLSRIRREHAPLCERADLARLLAARGESVTTIARCTHLSVPQVHEALAVNPPATNRGDPWGS